MHASQCALHAGCGRQVICRRALQFLQIAHPPARNCKGRVSRVHRGFLATWTANGLSARILGYIQHLLASHPEPESMKVSAQRMCCASWMAICCSC